MKKTSTLKRGLLAAASVAALTLGSTAAMADTVGFAPGAAIAGAQANIHGSVDLDTINAVNTFNWTSTNDAIASGGSSAAAAVETAGIALGLDAADRARSWFINISDNGVAGTSGDDTFTESFTFLLTTTEDGTLGSDRYGDGDFESHVFMRFVGSGFINNIGAVGDDYDDDAVFGLNYTNASFTMYFDPDGLFDTDGNVDNENVDAVTIATFGGTGGTVDAFDSQNRGNLEWQADWELANPGVFELPIGEDVNAGLLAGLEAFKVTDQDVVRRKVAGTDSQYLLTADGSATGRSDITQRVPEPGALALFGVGLLGLGVVARRRRKTAA